MLLGASSLDGAVEGRGERSMGRDKCGKLLRGRKAADQHERYFFVEMMDLGTSFLS